MLKFKSGRSPMQNFMLAMALAICVTLLLSALPTQWFAATMGYDRGLGEPLWIGESFAVYLPFDWLAWGWKFGDYAAVKPAVNMMTFMGVASIVIGLCSGFVIAYFLNRTKTGMDDLHGSAHWASTEEVDSTGFLPTKGRKVDGAMVGSVMIDGKRRVVHPMHPAYNRRYRRLMGWRNPDSLARKIRLCTPKMVSRIPSWATRMLGGEQLRDKDGVPRYEVNPGVVKAIELLRADDPTHILAFAPTRSGKGVGLVLPTLLTWRHSVLVNDIKGENWALSAGFRRAAGQFALKFEPACLDGSTAKWNPLDEIRTYSRMDVQDAQGIMMMVCDPKGEGLEDHWAKTSWEFLTGLALHLAYVGGPGATLAGMASYLGDPRWDDEKQMYTTMLNEEHDKRGVAGWKDTEGNPTKIHPAVANAAKTMLNKEDKERTSVLSTAKSFLSLYLDPVVAENTSRSDFLVRDLMNADKPVSFYFVVQPADLERMVPLSRLFYSMVIRRNAADMHFAEGKSVQGYKHRLLMLIDELPALKKLSVLQEGLGYIAGYGLKCYLICQDLIQLEEAYGDKQTILAGCHTRIAYAPNTQETADKLSAMTGKTTIHEEKASSSQGSWGFNTPNVSLSTDKTGRELMTAAEFLALNPDDMVLFVAGRAPIFGRKIKYYEDAVMQKRAEMKAPAKSDVIRLPKAEVEVAVREAPVGISDKVAAARAEWVNRMAAAAREGVAELPRSGMGGEGDGGDEGNDDGEDGGGVAIAEAMKVKTAQLMRTMKGMTQGEGATMEMAPGEKTLSEGATLDGASREMAPLEKPKQAVASSVGDNAVFAKKRSFYANRQAPQISEADKAKIQAIVANASVVDRVATFEVF